MVIVLIFKSIRVFCLFFGMGFFFFFDVRQGLWQQFKYFWRFIYLILQNDVCTDIAM